MLFKEVDTQNSNNKEVTYKQLKKCVKQCRKRFWKEKEKERDFDLVVC